MLKIGERVVVRGHGVGTITGVGTAVIRVKAIESGDDDGAYEIPVAQAGEVLRPLVTPDVAQAAIVTLKGVAGRESRDVADRSIAYRRAAKGGVLADQIRELAAIYRNPEPEYPEKQYQELLERAVYGELALVLDRPLRSLKTEMRKAILGEGPPAVLAFPDHSAELAAARQPAIATYDAQGAFAIDTKLAIGELAAEVVLDAATGVWFAYTHGEMDDPEEHMIAIHRDHVTRHKVLDANAQPCGHSTAEAASIALCDLAQLDDLEFVNEVLSEGSGIHGQRCFRWHVGGDGRFPVRAASIDGRVVYVRVDFD